MNFTDCIVPWIDNFGCITKTSYLRTCLIQKGWKYSHSKPASFKAGYPIFSNYNSHVMLVTAIEGKNIRYCSHSKDSCDKLTDSVGFEYFYE